MPKFYSLTFAFLCFFIFLAFEGIEAATSLHLGGVNGGSMKVGEDTDACNSSKQGAIRYNAGASYIQICTDKTGSFSWTNWGS